MVYAGSWSLGRLFLSFLHFSLLLRGGQGEVPVAVLGGLARSVGHGDRVCISS